MKRAVLALMIITILTSMILMPAMAAADDVKVTVDGKAVSFPDAKPFIDTNNRTLIPVRFVSEALGAKVEWNGKTREVSISQGENKIKVRINDQDIVVNNSVKGMDTKAIIKNDRTFVPILFVGEALGAVVTWDAKARTVVITTSAAAKDSHIINGYVVPNETVVIVEEPAKANHVEIALDILYTHPDEKPISTQMEEIRKVIASKWGEERAKEIYDYISQKKNPDITLEGKSFDFDGQEVYVVGVGWSAAVVIYERSK